MAVPAVVLLSLPFTASAASVTNRDEVDRKVTIIEGEVSKDVVLKKDDSLEGICERGCTVRIDGDDVNPYLLEGSEVTTIEGGDLYAEGQGPLGNPSRGSPGQPSPPRP